MRKLIWLLLLIVMVAFIFYNSSLPAVQSDGASRLLASYIQGFANTLHIHLPTTNLNHDFEEEEVKLPFLSNGYEYEAMEVERCIREHLTESPVHPMKQAIDTLSLMDGCRKLWGVKYSVD